MPSHSVRWIVGWMLAAVLAGPMLAADRPDLLWPIIEESNRNLSRSVRGQHQQVDADQSAENLRKAYEMVRARLRSPDPSIGMDFVNKVHEVINQGDPQARGGLPRHVSGDNVGYGEGVNYPGPRSVGEKYAQLDGFLREQTSGSMRPRGPAVEAAARVHNDISRWHIYNNGNGRVSRLISDYVLMANGLPPATHVPAAGEKVSGLVSRYRVSNDHRQWVNPDDGYDALLKKYADYLDDGVKRSETRIRETVAQRNAARALTPRGSASPASSAGGIGGADVPAATARSGATGGAGAPAVARRPGLIAPQFAESLTEGGAGNAQRSSGAARGGQSPAPTGRAGGAGAPAMARPPGPVAPQLADSLTEGGAAPAGRASGVRTPQLIQGITEGGAAPAGRASGARTPQLIQGLTEGGSNSALRSSGAARGVQTPAPAGRSAGADAPRFVEGITEPGTGSARRSNGAAPDGRAAAPVGRANGTGTPQSVDSLTEAGAGSAQRGPGAARGTSNSSSEPGAGGSPRAGSARGTGNPTTDPGARRTSISDTSSNDPGASARGRGGETSRAGGGGGEPAKAAPASAAARGLGALKQNFLVGAGITVGSALVRNITRNGLDWKGARDTLGAAGTWAAVAGGAAGAALGSLIPGGKLVSTLATVGLGSVGARAGAGEKLDWGSIVAGTIGSTALSLAFGPLGIAGVIAGGILGNWLGERAWDHFRKPRVPPVRLVQPRFHGGPPARGPVSPRLLGIGRATDPVTSVTASKI